MNFLEMNIAMLLNNPIGCNMKKKIIVEEEYGYRYWLWEINTKAEKSIEGYFRKVIGSGLDGYWYCVGEPKEHFIGEWKQLDYEDYKVLVDTEDYDAVAHIHEHHDSWIKFES